MKRTPTLLPLALGAVLLLSATFALMAQLPALPTLQPDPDLVYVRVSALEPTRGRPMRGFKAEQLKVLENNAPQVIVHFSEDTLPLHMGILTDVSGTSKDDTIRALSLMTRTGSRDDEFIMLETAKAPLHDAVLQALDMLAQRGSHGKSALLVVTSKKDPGSYPLTKVRERLKELDIQFYVTVLQTGSEDSSDTDRQILTELTARTGGAAYFPSSLALQTDIFKRIVVQLRSQYLIGYRPTNRATDGKWRKIKITGEYPDSKTGKIRKTDILAKTGYYAPTAPR